MWASPYYGPTDAELQGRDENHIHAAGHLSDHADAVVECHLDEWEPSSLSFQVTFFSEDVERWEVTLSLTELGARKLQSEHELKVEAGDRPTGSLVCPYANSSARVTLADGEVQVLVESEDKEGFWVSCSIDVNKDEVVIM